MYELDSINELLTALQKKFDELLQSGERRQAIAYIDAQESLTDWRDRGQSGDIPQHVQALTDLDWRSFLRLAEKSPARRDEPTKPSPASAVPVQEIPFSPAATLGAASSLAAARQLLEAGKLDEANILLERLERETIDPAERRVVEAVRGEWRARARRGLEEALQAARRCKSERPDDYAGQRQRWQAVLGLDANHKEAADEITRLDTQELSQAAFRDIRQIRADMPTIRRRIDRVEEARSQVDRMRYDNSLQGAEIQAEIERLHNELTTFRDEILRVSEGGTSSERSQQYDKAIQVYRNAVRAGFTQIVDDVGGDPVDPAIRLREALAARNKDFISRTADRYNDAEVALRAGTPEVAVEKLTDARGILTQIESDLTQIESDGDAWRRKVDQLLEQAQTSVRSKERASSLVAESETAAAPQQARNLLLEARDAYLNFPRLTERIQQKERQLVDRVLVEMRLDRLRTEDAMSDRRYDEARAQAEQMLRRGQELDFITDNAEFRQQRQQAEELLRQINSEQRTWQHFQERIKNVSEALALPDVELAHKWLETLARENPDHPDVVDLRTRLTLLGSNEKKWSEAQQFFNQAHNFEQVISLCESLASSPQFKDQAQRLQRRARARLLGQQAREQSSLGLLAEAQQTYNRILDLRGLLPAEDEHLLNDAASGETVAAQRLEQTKRYEQRLEDISRLRSQGLWSDWLARLQALEKDAGDLLQRETSAERAAGIPLWREDALDKAESALISRDAERWRRAYAHLEPLYKLGAIEDENTRYRDIAYNYHQYEADLRRESKNPQELEEGVDHLRQLLAVSDPPALKEKEALQQAIRRRALRLAQYEAASNPKRAVKVLLEQLESHQFELREDSDVRGHLVRYALLVEEFETAHSAAQALQFLPGMREQARAWQQLVQAVESFGQDEVLTAWENGVNSLADVRVLAGRSAGLVNETLEEFATRMADRLFASLPPITDVLSNEKILHRVRIFALILQLKSEDSRAHAGVGQLENRLNALGNELNNRARRLLSEEQNDSNAEVEQLSALDGEMGALHQAFQLLPNQKEGDTAQLLEQNRRKVQLRAQELQEYRKQFSEVETLYRKALQESWETGSLDGALQAAVRTARGLGFARQAGQWEGRVRQLKEVLAELKQILVEMERHWIGERYAEVQERCEALETVLRRGRQTLNERALALPAAAIDLYDAHARRNLTSPEAVRSAAKEKEQNLILWQRWAKRFEELQASIGASEQKFTEYTEATPPCRSKAREELSNLVRYLQNWGRHLEEKSLPPAPLSNEANRYGRMIEEANLRERIVEQIANRQQQLAEIDQLIDQLDRPLAQLRAFMSGDVKMGQRPNQETFRRRAEAIRQVDACHPELLSLIERFERLARVKY
jgi:hypothetical protein